MKLSTLIRRNLAYYWRTNLAVIAGVATAVAVLSGALLVGDSVRSSLRDLVLARLGRAETVVSSALFFREALAGETGTCPMIALEGVVEHEGKRANSVQIYGVDDRFWKFHGLTPPEAADREALLSAALAAEIAAKPGDSVIVRMEMPSAIPKDSMHGRKESASRAIRFAAGAILSGAQLGEFALRPTQGPVLAAFVPLSRLQRDLAQRSRVNTLLAGGGGFDQSKVTLEDLGIRIRPLSDSLSVESESAILSDNLAAKVREAGGAGSIPVLSYLANAIRAGEKTVPYSLVTAIDPRMLPPGAAPDTIYFNEWTSRELQAKPGERVTLDYYHWLDSGDLVTRSAEFTLGGILPMSGLSVDRDLTPEYPGITEADTIGDWDPPFPVDLKLIRPADEDYWKRYRTSPKAFLTLEAGQRLWKSRFGGLTSVRVPGVADVDAYRKKLREAIDPSQLGMAVYSPRSEGLQASRGATDFGEYFSYFSFFLMISAVLLAGLFFQLGVEQRIREIGTLRAEGFSWRDVRKLFAREALPLGALGSLIGAAGAVAYAAFLLFGLRTWWNDAVGTSLLRLHIGAQPLRSGIVSGVFISLLFVMAALRMLRRKSPRSLLAGTQGDGSAMGAARRWPSLLAALAAISLLGLAVTKRIPDAAGFFGAGALLLVAAITGLLARLRSTRRRLTTGILSLGFRNASYRPGRSTLSIALIASAVFLLVALEAFRRPPIDAADPKSGAGGFSLMAESRIPIFWDLNSDSGREQVNLTNAPRAKFFAFRLRPGDDASCLNLYEPRNPRVLGAPRAFLEAGRFPFVNQNSPNPWMLLEQDLPEGVIPAIADANSLEYVLHKKIGEEIQAGGARLRVVAALRDSILQSELIIAEKHFTRAFPEIQGFRYFLTDAPAESAGVFEEALSDFGFDAASTLERLATYHRVENTYLSTFQALGGLGLLLGTIGLAVVLMRNVIERRRELALMRAVGFRPGHLGRMVVAENVYLLAWGILIGTVCALLAVAPALLSRGSAPSLSLVLMLAAVPAVGLLASLVAVRMAVRAPLLATLRSE